MLGLWDARALGFTGFGPPLPSQLAFAVEVHGHTQTLLFTAGSVLCFNGKARASAPSSRECVSNPLSLCEASQQLLLELLSSSFKHQSALCWSWDAATRQQPRAFAPRASRYTPVSTDGSQELGRRPDVRIKVSLFSAPTFLLQTALARRPVLSLALPGFPVVEDNGFFPSAGKGAMLEHLPLNGATESRTESPEEAAQTALCQAELLSPPHPPVPPQWRCHPWFFASHRSGRPAKCTRFAVLAACLALGTAGSGGAEGKQSLALRRVPVAWPACSLASHWV